MHCMQSCVCELTHPLATADDRQERLWLFVVPIAGSGFDGSIDEIRTNVQPKMAQKVKPNCTLA